MKFEDVIGLGALKKQLVNSVTHNKVSHAQMFLGPEGSGGLSLAMAFAQYINCPDRTEEDSCGVCASCKKMKKLIHPDVHFTYPTISTGSGKPSLSKDFIQQWREIVIDNPYINYMDWLSKLNAENKQGNITIAECHEIIKHLSLKSYEGGNKIQIVWLPEFLGKNGNSLLKIIEEPTPNTFFIFISHNKELILNTILSRVQTSLIPPVKEDEIIQGLQKRFELAEDEAGNIAHLADGNYSEALRLYHTGQNDHAERFIHWMRQCFKLDTLEINRFITESQAKGREYIKDFLKYGIRIIREAYLLGKGLKQITHLGKAEQEFASNFSSFITDENHHQFYDLLNKNHYYIERNANPKIIIFNLSLQFHKLLKKK